MSNRRKIFCARIDLVISSMDFRVFLNSSKARDKFCFLGSSILVYARGTSFSQWAFSIEDSDLVSSETFDCVVLRFSLGYVLLLIPKDLLRVLTYK